MNNFQLSTFKLIQLRNAKRTDKFSLCVAGFCGILRDFAGAREQHDRSLHAGHVNWLGNPVSNSTSPSSLLSPRCVSVWVCECVSVWVCECVSVRVSFVPLFFGCSLGRGFHPISPLTVPSQRPTSTTRRTSAATRHVAADFPTHFPTDFVFCFFSSSSILMSTSVTTTILIWHFSRVNSVDSINFQAQWIRFPLVQIHFGCVADLIQDFHELFHCGDCCYGNEGGEGGAGVVTVAMLPLRCCHDSNKMNRVAIIFKFFNQLLSIYYYYIYTLLIWCITEFEMWQRCNYY